jgi:hypothetical protein
MAGAQKGRGCSGNAKPEHKAPRTRNCRDCTAGHGFFAAAGPVSFFWILSM